MTAEECFQRGFEIAVRHEGRRPDFAGAIHWYRTAADAGHITAMLRLGSYYLCGQGVAEDRAEGLRWYLKAAEAGSPEGMYNVGHFYSFGGLNNSLDEREKALEWFQKAADAGHAEAMGAIGFCYQHGWGVTADDSEAIKWYRRAVQHGNLSAQDQLRELGKESYNL